MKSILSGAAKFASVWSLGELESFRNYKGLSIMIFPKILDEI